MSYKVAVHVLKKARLIVKNICSDKTDIVSSASQRRVVLKKISKVAVSH